MIDSAKAPFPVSLLCQILSNVRSCEPHSVTCAWAKVTSAFPTWLVDQGVRNIEISYGNVTFSMSKLPLLKRYYYCTGKNGFFQWEIYELPIWALILTLPLCLCTELVTYMCLVFRYLSFQVGPQKKHNTQALKSRQFYYPPLTLEGSYYCKYMYLCCKKNLMM